MKRAATLMMLLLLLASGLVQAQRRRDPLTDKESDELRETALEPLKRMKLLVTYARARMATIEQLRANPKLNADAGDQIRMLLEDVAGLVDETDENLATYKGKDSDLRKPLKLVVETNTDFQLKLRTLRETSSPEDLKRFGFALETTTDSVNSSADSARAMLDEQNASRGKEKPLSPKEEEKQRKADAKAEKEAQQEKARDEKQQRDQRQIPCPAPPC